ncbi:hypothetical protein EW026_g6940 [Hermanssonia centrifuga]|uniref:Pheromone receptor n=1 Tax=Hermanssonia centrifuga TaxID=98765 RepID=A0A4S4K9E6_9APHY|nr:hypothetical protein EW026_g6940 [Hermanssonia centrifuga]
MHPELPYIAFLAAALVLVPLPWHWRAGNVATLSMIFWLFLVDVIYGVDAVVWANNVEIVVPVWCDITTKVIVGANFALPAACMCVCVHLAQVASVSQVRTSINAKRRRQIIEFIFCYLLPAIWMALHYIVQGHRFDIIEVYGCRATNYVSLPAIFLMWFPPLLMSVIASIFASIALVSFVRRRLTFAKHLESNDCGLNLSRYMRLISMTFIQMVISVIATTSTMVFSIKNGYRPWTNWADVHWDFSRIDQYPIDLLPPFYQNFYYAIWWIIPASSFIFFIFFAFGQEAMKEYRGCATWVRRSLHLHSHGSRSQISSTGPLTPGPFTPGPFSPLSRKRSSGIQLTISSPISSASTDGFLTSPYLKDSKDFPTDISQVDVFCYIPPAVHLKD